MKISELKERKRELGFSNKMVSALSGVPLSTVEKIFGGATTSPRYETLRQIENALYGEADYAYSSFYGFDEDFTFNGKRQGEYTVEDCLSFPEGTRMELIDGVLYDMASPTAIHQMIVGQVFARIAAVLDSVPGDCDVFTSPLDVQFSEENIKDQFEPDMLIVCGKHKYSSKAEKILGSPDMVMEVISPSSRGKDRVLKLNKYLENGVREYWIVDPEVMEIHVYSSEGSPGFVRYSFEDVVPLRIFDGKISVNFAAITRRLRERLGFGSK